MPAARTSRSPRTREPSRSMPVYPRPRRFPFRPPAVSAEPSPGGFNGVVSLTAGATPAGLTTSCVPVSISGTQTSTCTMSGSTPGSYTVIVTGTNGTLSHTASITVTVAAPGPPTARFTFAPPYPKVNNSVAFDASSSTDPDPSATLQARWDWEGDGVWDTPLSSTLTIQHVFTSAGTYLVKLEIVDSHGLTAIVTVIADHSDQGVSPVSPAVPTVPILIGMSPVVALAAIHAFLWNRTRTPRKRRKKQTAVVCRFKPRDPWLFAANGVIRR